MSAVILIRCNTHHAVGAVLWCWSQFTTAGVQYRRAGTHLLRRQPTSEDMNAGEAGESDLVEIDFLTR